MKKRWTKYLALLSVSACVFSLTACSEEKDTSVTYSDETAAAIEEELASSGSEYELDDWVKTYVESFVTSIETDFIAVDRDELLENYEDDETWSEAAQSYLDATEELGEYKDEEPYDLTFEMDDETLSISGMLVFEERDLNFNYTGNYTTGEVSLVFERQLSIAEILQKAGMNTLLGMGTVFLVLILISFVIKMFGLLSADKKDKPEATKAEEPKAAAPAVAPATTVQAQNPAADDIEMAIVIATAIAAAEEETGTSGYRVRSIKRAKNSKWRRA